MEYKRDEGTGFEYEIIKTSGCEEYHCHNRLEIMYVKSGYLRLRTDMSRSVCDIHTGDYAVISSSDVHRCFCMNKCEYVLIRFPVSFQNMLGIGRNVIRNSFAVSHEILEKNPIVRDILNQIRIFLSRENPDTSITANLCSSMCSILVSFYDRRIGLDFSRDAAADNSLILSTQSISFETMEKFDLALDYIKNHYTDNKINLEMLSRLSGLNRSFLSALFPKLTGRNFKDYLNYLRVDKAIELIVTSDKNISEIAFLCGFETIRTLNNVFKSVAGVTPSELRMGASGKKKAGIDTEISAVGSKIFDYRWICSVESENLPSDNAIRIFSKDVDRKRWCHLMLRMLFFAGREYSVSFKAKILDENVNHICCNFCFPDRVKNIEHHSPRLVEKNMLDDGWIEFVYSYKMPEYYKPSSSDNFSVFSSPYDEKAVGYLVKDIVVKIV